MGGYNAVGAPVLAGSGLRLNELVPWSLFDSRRYLEHNYMQLREEDEQIIKLVREFFVATAGHLGGRGRGIDIGTGTNLYPALTMLPWCAQIALLEFADTNRAWLRHEKTAGYSASWDPFWDLLAGDEHYRSTGDPRQAFTARTNIVPDSVFKLDRYHKGRQEAKWDIGTMFFVAESISQDRGQFETATRCFVHALKDGAPFAAAFMTNSTGYQVGDDFFPAVPVDEEQVRECLGRFAEDVETYPIPSTLREDTGMVLALGRAGKGLTTTGW